MVLTFNTVFHLCLKSRSSLLKYCIALWIVIIQMFIGGVHYGMDIETGYITTPEEP